MKASGAVEVQLHSLTSALDRGECLGSCPRDFTTRERDICTHWVGPRTWSECFVEEKNLVLMLEFEPGIILPTT
jgi:hypothetical protein